MNGEKSLVDQMKSNFGPSFSWGVLLVRAKLSLKCGTFYLYDIRAMVRLGPLFISSAQCYRMG